MKSKSNWLFLTFFFLLVGCGKDGGTPGTNPVVSDTVTDMRRLSDANDRTTFVGKKVDLVGVKVVGRPLGNFIFLAGEINRKVPVVRMDKMGGAATKPVKEGDTVNITGVIRLLSEVPNNDRMWETHVPGVTLTTAQRDVIKAEKIYIQADKVTLQ